MMNDEKKIADDEAEAAATVEELELEWWEPLGCKCDVDFED